MEIACMLGSCQQTHSGNGISVFLTPSNWVYLSHTGRRLQFTVLSGVSVLTWTLGPLCYGLFNPPRYSVRKLSACDGENPLTPLMPHWLLCVFKQLLFTFTTPKGTFQFPYLSFMVATCKKASLFIHYTLTLR